METRLLPDPSIVWGSLPKESRRRIANIAVAGGDIDAALRRFAPNLRYSRVGILRRFIREERSKPWGGALGS